MNTSPPALPLRPSHLEIDLAAYAHNLQAIARHVGVPFLAVVKANAYGHGLVPMARHALVHGAAGLGVALAEEGLALRQAGIHAPILVLGGLFPEQLPASLAAGLEITVPSLQRLQETLRAAEQLGKAATVHLKIDTGMARIGVALDTAPALIEAALASPWCKVKGIFSHLASADEPASPQTGAQLAGFLEACAYFSRIGAPMPIRHLANSGGIMNFPDTWLDMVRPGIMSYGVMPGENSLPSVPLRPVLALKSRVAHFKRVAAGAPVSYGATWHSPAASGIATLPLGYGDGVARALSSRGTVLIGGQRHRIAGRVCMDQLMVASGDAEIAAGDEAVLIGRQGGEVLRAEEVAATAGTIAYELLVNMNPRLPRCYLNG